MRHEEAVWRHLQIHTPYCQQLALASTTVGSTTTVPVPPTPRAPTPYVP